MDAKSVLFKYYMWHCNEHCNFLYFILFCTDVFINGNLVHLKVFTFNVGNEISQTIIHRTEMTVMKYNGMREYNVCTLHHLVRDIVQQ